MSRFQCFIFFEEVNKGQLTLSLRTMPIGIFLDYFSFSHFLASSCCLYKKRLSSLKYALNFVSNKPIFCYLRVLSAAAQQTGTAKLPAFFQNLKKKQSALLRVKNGICQPLKWPDLAVLLF